MQCLGLVIVQYDPCIWNSHLSLLCICCNVVVKSGELDPWDLQLVTSRLEFPQVHSPDTRPKSCPGWCWGRGGVPTLSLCRAPFLQGWPHPRAVLGGLGPGPSPHHGPEGRTDASCTWRGPGQEGRACLNPLGRLPGSPGTELKDSTGKACFFGGGGCYFSFLPLFLSILASLSGNFRFM